MDQELRDLLSRINELTDEELENLESRLVDEFDRLDGENRSPDVVAAMDEVAQGIGNVRSESAGREQSRIEADQRAEELRRQVHGSEGEEDGGEGGESAEGEGAEGAEAEGAEGEEGAEDEEGEGKPKSERQPIAASAARGRSTRPTPSEMNSRRSAAHTPKGDGRGSARVRLMAHAGGKQAGDQLESMSDIAVAFAERIASLGRGSGERLLVARAEVDYPEDRDVRGLAPHQVSAKFDAVLNTDALVASGGICVPVAVDYGVLVTADDSEPVADSLPSFQATRGGLRFIPPPSLASVPATGQGYWTAANDANPGSNGPATKPVMRVDCLEEAEVLVDAIPFRMQFGNMTARFAPEQIEAQVKLALSNAARVREVHRLNTIAADSTAVTSAQLLGASRDLLATLDQVSAAYRYRHRIKRGAVQLRAIFPDWAIDMFKADLTREIAHGEDNNLRLSDADVTSLIANRGVQVTWAMDGQPTNAAGGPGGPLAFPAQDWGNAAAQSQGAILDWPHTMVWYLFAEGTFQRLDGGQLDLGVVRDATLDSTNDYETFVETFEGIAKRGVESLQVLSAVRPNGASAGTVGTAASPVIY